jgi:membrane protein
MLQAVNIAYDEERRRTWLQQTLVSIAFTAASVVMVALAIGLVVALPIALAAVGLDAMTETAVSLARWPVLFAMVAAWTTLLYRFGPVRRPPKWRWVTWGALIATCLWLLGSFLLSAFVRNVTHLGQMYGPLTAVIVLQLWFFVSSYVVLLGAEINSEMELQTRLDTTRGPDRPMGERGAVAADGLGPCQPPVWHSVRDRAKDIKTQTIRLSRVRLSRPNFGRARPGGTSLDGTGLDGTSLEPPDDKEPEEPAREAE